jgi:glutamyl-tRNA synthetase
MADGCVMFYQDFDVFNEKQAIKQFNLKSKPLIEALYSKLLALDIWNAETVHSAIQEVCEQEGVGFGKVGQPFRLALSGDGKAGSIDVCAALVGKNRTLARLKMAIDYIKNL